MNSAPTTYSSPIPARPLTTTYTPTTYVSPTAGSGFTFLGLSVTTWIIIILVLAFLGFNVFLYLAKGTQAFSDIFGYYVKYFASLIGYTAANVTSTAATGTKTGVDVAAGVVDSAANVVQQTVDSAVSGATATSSLTGSQKTSASVPQEDSTQNTNLDAALRNKNMRSTQEEDTYDADDANSAIQSNKSTSKSGWCYIGESRGFRSCVQVGDNDNCVSGDIFPSRDICVNPNLRA